MSERLLLENRLKYLSEKNEEGDILWTSYKKMKRRLKKGYYRFIQSKCPYYTDHGENHIKAVMKGSGDLLEDNIEDLNEMSIFLLLSSIIWHDVGMVLGRTDHAKKVGNVTKDLKELFPEEGIRRVMTKISRSHSGDKGLKIPNDKDYCSVNSKDYTVYPKALAAILRFSDEFTEDRSRVSEDVIDQVPSDQRIYWEYALCITTTTVELNRNRVILKIEIPSSKVLNRYVAPKEFEQYADKNNEMSLIEYIVGRLEKLNEERCYCAPEFKRYDVNIEEISARLTLLKDDTDGIDEYENKEILLRDHGLKSKKHYPSIKIYQEFFEKFSQWKIKNIKEAISDV
ncbi:MAG: HD domain-containing protein [archaeon]